MHKTWESERTAEELLYTGYIDLCRVQEAKELFIRSAAKGNNDAAWFVTFFDVHPEVVCMNTLLEALKKEPPGRLSLAAIGRMLHARREDEEARIVLSQAIEFEFPHAYGILGSVIPYGEQENFWVWKEGVLKGDPRSMQWLAHRVETKEEKRSLLTAAAENGACHAASLLLKEFGSDADVGTWIRWVQLYISFEHPRPNFIEPFIGKFIEGDNSLHPSDDDVWVKYTIGKMCMCHYIGTSQWDLTEYLLGAVKFYDETCLRVETSIFYSLWMLQREFRMVNDIAMKIAKDLHSSRDDILWIGLGPF